VHRHHRRRKSRTARSATLTCPTLARVLRQAASLTFQLQYTSVAGPVIRRLTCLDPVALWLTSSIAGSSVGAGRSAGSIGPQTPSTASPPGPTDSPPPTLSRGNRRSQHAGQLAAPRDPTTSTVKGPTSSDRSAAGFGRDEHQTGANRPKPSRTATGTWSGSLTPFRVRTRPAPVSLQFV
jgi:hypothetical protein